MTTDQPFDNPYRPAPGSQPPALAGRDGELSAGLLGFAATRAGAPSSPIVLTGLRGMGKTATLRKIVMNGDERAVVLSAEASPDIPTSVALRSSLEKARAANASLGTRLRHAFTTVLGALPAISVGNDAASVTVTGRGSEAEIPEPFAGSLAELNDELRRHERYLVIAIDEIQETPIEDLRHIVRTVHESAGTAHPILLLGAGLPNSQDHLHRVRTYTERWRFFRLELLHEPDTRRAIQEPALERGVRFDERALVDLVHYTAGYPFFIQEYASAAWMIHTGKRVTHDDVERSAPGVQRSLESSFYEARFRKLTPREVTYVLAMTELGDGPISVGEIAEHLGAKSEQLSSIRNQLVRKDVLFAPSGGLVEFRVPLSERYIRQHRVMLERRAAPRDQLVMHPRRSGGAD